jgi:hypothetical protein
MGEMMDHKQKLFLFQTTMGEGELITRTFSTNIAMLSKLERTQRRFNTLAEAEKDQILGAYDAQFSSYDSRSFLDRLHTSISLLLFKTPPFERPK